jgi:NAD(P)-dependent dehydrogenase (short-subunit alcohol dehydrogenase family)
MPLTTTPRILAPAPPIAVLTGGSRGIGRATALGLAGAGYQVVLVTRTEESGAMAVRDLATVVPGRFSFVAADLRDLGAVLEAGRILVERYPRISLLVNNAAVALRTYQATPAGVEETLAVNHLATVVLTYGVLPALLVQGAVGGARILNVSSEAHAKQLDLTAFEGPNGYAGFHAYAQSKLLNLIHAFDLARTLEGTGIQVHAVHPGLVATELLSGFVPAGILRRMATPLIHLLAMSPEAGARTSIYAATHPDTLESTGRYFVKRAAAEPAPVARDPEVHDGVHQWTEALTGIAWRHIPYPPPPPPPSTEWRPSRNPFWAKRSAEEAEEQPPPPPAATAREPATPRKRPTKRRRTDNPEG